MILPRLYIIIDAEVCRARAMRPVQMARELAAAGVTLVQYRDKSGSPQQTLAVAAAIRQTMPAATLIMNDRSDLAILSGYNGVHVGQNDLSVGNVRTVLPLDGIVGVSTHNDAQVEIADQTSADYVAIGPIFSTSTKLDAAPTVGLEGIRTARALTGKPLVAIGGITRENARSVIEAGADSIAIISALFVPGQTVEQTAHDFLALLS